MDAGAVRSELAELWQATLERVLAGLAASAARTTDSEMPALRRLQQLRSFLFAGEPQSLRLAEAAPQQLQAGVALLCDLLQSQARLRAAADPEVAAAGTSIVQQHLRRGLLQLAQGCRHSEWTLAHFVASGLARQCRELALLGRFCADAALARQLGRLELQLIFWHAATQPPAAPALARLQQQLLALARGQPGLCELLLAVAEPAAVPLPIDLSVLEELARLRAWLQPALQAGATASVELMCAAYRLAWVLQAVGADLAADCGMLVYQLLARHWQQFEQVSPPVCALLQAWLALLPQQPQQPQQPAVRAPADLPEPLLRWCSAAVAAWPDRSGEQDAAVLLGGGSNRVMQELSIRQVPEHMATALQALLQVDAGWFGSRAAWQRCRPLLLQELQVLEQGAAALRLTALETFSSALLAWHAQLELALPQQDWPASGLWQAHRELVATLDRAALWQHPVPAPAVQELLQAQLQRGEQQLQRALQDAAALDAVSRVAAALSLFCLQASRLLGRSVRLSLCLQQADAASPVLPSALERPLLHTLQEILRWLLLQHDSSAELRRSQRLPRATALQVTLQLPAPAAAADSGSGPSCELDVEEQGVRGLPGSKALQRLQRSLAAGVQQLHCEGLPPQGRRVRCRLQVPAEAVPGNDGPASELPAN